MGMGKIKALKIRSIGFFAPDFLHVAFLGFSAKKRLRHIIGEFKCTVFPIQMYKKV